MLKDKMRNRIVGLFMLAGLALFGWMVMQFGDLPSIVSRYNSRIVAVWLPEIADLHVNSKVVFKGYSVGKILEVMPPAPRPDPAHPDQTSYDIKMLAAISNNYAVPANVQARVFRGGLGAGFLELTLDGAPAEAMLADGQELNGYVSTASQFVSEDTQKKLDDLIVSIAQLSKTMQAQLTPRPPDQVDAANQVYANMTTTIIRLDETLRHFNTILGDPENQQNVKQAIAAIRDAAATIRQTAQQAGVALEDTRSLVASSKDAVVEVKDSVQQLTTTYNQAGVQMLSVMDELSGSLSEMRKITAQIASGQGTLGLMVSDPRLYESIADVAQRLDLTMQVMNQLLQQWQQEGVKMKLK